MKIYDYDTKFFEYASGWMALHPNMKPEEAELHYNEMMSSWLDIPAKWLDGVKPGEYFKRYSEPKDLIKLLEEYDKRDFGIPEPLYARVVEVGAPCVEPLVRIALNTDRRENLRGTAIAIVQEIGGEAARQMDMTLMLTAKEKDEFADGAAEHLKQGADSALAAELMEKYDSLKPWVQDLVLDVCIEVEPVPEQLYERLIYKLHNSAQNRAYYASLLGELGDPRAIEPLREMMELSDVDYLDYIEIRNAIGMLGGELEDDDRSFSGDEGYEALRNM